MTDPIASLIVGDTSEMRQLRALIARVASTEIPVIVQGPTGAGKELVARALHVASGRRGKLVAFNVCAVAETMFEDALFGHVKGAFTGAVADAPGYLAEADEGTIFLDEIGGLPIAQQAKLLRVLETREFRPVGARYDRRSSFRIVAATNVALPTLVTAGRFRADLAHRLSGFVFQVPSLADRADDVPLLARHLLRADGRVHGDFTEAALSLLQAEPWPGNVRELRHVVERAAVLSTTQVIGRTAVAAALQSGREPSRPRDAFARRRLLDLLARCHWDTMRVAMHLGVHRATVYRRMKRLGIDALPVESPRRRPDARSDSAERAGTQPLWRA